MSLLFAQMNDLEHIWNSSFQGQIGKAPSLDAVNFYFPFCQWWHVPINCCLVSLQDGDIAIVHHRTRRTFHKKPIVWHDKYKMEKRPSWPCWVKKDASFFYKTVFAYHCNLTQQKEEDAAEKILAKTNNPRGGIRDLWEKI